MLSPRNYLLLSVLALAACESGTAPGRSAPALTAANSAELMRASDQKGAPVLAAAFAEMRTASTLNICSRLARTSGITGADNDALD
jgi:hypothetical protein